MTSTTSSNTSRWNDSVLGKPPASEMISGRSGQRHQVAHDRRHDARGARGEARVVARRVARREGGLVRCASRLGVRGGVESPRGSTVRSRESRPRPPGAETGSGTIARRADPGTAPPPAPCPRRASCARRTSAAPARPIGASSCASAWSGRSGYVVNLAVFSLLVHGARRPLRRSPPSWPSASPGPTTSSSTSSGPSSSTAFRRSSRAPDTCGEPGGAGPEPAPARAARAGRDAGGPAQAIAIAAVMPGQLPAQPPLVLPVGRDGVARDAAVAPGSRRSPLVLCAAASRRGGAGAAPRAVGEPTPRRGRRGRAAPVDGRRRDKARRDPAGRGRPAPPRAAVAHRATRSPRSRDLRASCSDWIDGPHDHAHRARAATPRPGSGHVLVRQQGRRRARRPSRPRCFVSDDERRRSPRSAPAPRWRG